MLLKTEHFQNFFSELEEEFLVVFGWDWLGWYVEFAHEEIQLEEEEKTAKR